MIPCAKVIDTGMLYSSASRLAVFKNLLMYFSTCAGFCFTGLPDGGFAGVASLKDSSSSESTVTIRMFLMVVNFDCYNFALMPG